MKTMESLRELLSPNKSRKMSILLCGLEKSGKTSLLYRTKTGKVVDTKPTIGFNVEEIAHKGMSFVFYDCGGSTSQQRMLWRTEYLAQADAIFFVLDSSKPQKLTEAVDELAGLLEDPRADSKPVCILGNKEEISNMNAKQILPRFAGFLKEDNWRFQFVSAIHGVTFEESFNWLIEKRNEANHSQSQSQSQTS